MNYQFRHWWLWAGALVIPFTAILHNRIFFRSECILNSFGPDYYPDIVFRWLRRDPSFALAAGLSLATFILGKRWPKLQLLSVAFFVSFIPISLWVWDIPFTGRIICHRLHDGHSFLRSPHLYIFGALSFPFVVMVLRGLFKAQSELKPEAVTS